MNEPRKSAASLVGALLILIAALALSACGDDEIGGGNEAEVTVAAAEGEPRGELAISNWALYIDPDTIGEYEDSSGVSVDYVEEINSYDSFFSKMQPLLERGESGDRSLMVASDWLAKKMYDLGYIQRLDKEALAPAFSHLSPAVKAPSSDPDWSFSIPWQGGMTGLIINEAEAPGVRSINDIFDPAYKGRVEVVSELREVVPLLLTAEGIEPEDATEEDWLAAIERLDQAVDSGQIRRITGGDYARDLANGDADVVIGWAADAIQLQADKPELQWVMPTEGCMLWWDNWVIPVGAPNPTAAYDWINYAYDPENQAQIVGWTSSVTPVAGVEPIIERTDPAQARNELIFPTESYTENCSTPISPPGGPEGEKAVEAAWAEAAS